MVYELWFGDLGFKFWDLGLRFWDLGFRVSGRLPGAPRCWPWSPVPRACRHQGSGPLSSECGTYTTVKDRFLPWLSGKSPTRQQELRDFPAKSNPGDRASGLTCPRRSWRRKPRGGWRRGPPRRPRAARACRAVPRTCNLRGHTIEGSHVQQIQHKYVVSQSRPDSGLFFQVKVLKTCQGGPFSLDSGRVEGASVHPATGPEIRVRGFGIFAPRRRTDGIRNRGSGF